MRRWWPVRVTTVTDPVRPRQISGAKMPGTHEPSPPVPASAMKSRPFDQSKPRGLSRPVATTAPAESSTVLPGLLKCAVLRPAPAKEPPINNITKEAAHISVRVFTGSSLFASAS